MKWLTFSPLLDPFLRSIARKYVENPGENLRAHCGSSFVREKKESFSFSILYRPRIPARPWLTSRLDILYLLNLPESNVNIKDALNREGDYFMFRSCQKKKPKKEAKLNAFTLRGGKWPRSGHVAQNSILLEYNVCTLM